MRPAATARSRRATQAFSDLPHATLLIFERKAHSAHSAHNPHSADSAHSAHSAHTAHSAHNAHSAQSVRRLAFGRSLDLLSLPLASVVLRSLTRSERHEEINLGRTPRGASPRAISARKAAAARRG